MHHRTVKTPESAAVSLARANRSLAPPRPTPEGWARPRPTPEGRLYLIQRPMMDLASPDIRRLALSHLTNRALRTLMMTATG